MKEPYFIRQSSSKNAVRLPVPTWDTPGKRRREKKKTCYAITPLVSVEVFANRIKLEYKVNRAQHHSVFIQLKIASHNVHVPKSPSFSRNHTTPYFMLMCTHKGILLAESKILWDPYEYRYNDCPMRKGQNTGNLLKVTY